VFGGLVASCVAISVIFEDEINAHSAERAAVADAGLENVTDQARSILKQTAELDLTKEANCPSEFKSAPFKYESTSLAQLARLAPDAGSTAASPGLFTTKKINVLLKARDEDNKFDIADAIEELAEVQYVAVFVPEHSQAPKVVSKTTFEAGAFVGSVVMADFQEGKVLCHGRFQAVSSESLEGGPAIGLARGLVEIPLSDMQDKASDDYKRNFFTAAAQTIERIRLGSAT